MSLYCSSSLFSSSDQYNLIPSIYPCIDLPCFFFSSGGRAGLSRRWDVYMGIDVFGRNTYGGGGYDCDKALEVIRNAGVSAALFAPGW